MVLYMEDVSNSHNPKRVNTAKLFAISLGCTILMYLVVYVVCEVLLDSRDYFRKHLLFLLTGSSTVVGVVQSIIVSKKLETKCFHVYLFFLILTFLLLLMISLLTWRLMVVVLPQPLVVLFMIPGTIVQLLFLGFNYLKAKKSDM